MPTPTHCPYCALQCAQTLHRGAGCRAARCASRRATSRPTGAGCARRGGARRRCSARRTGSRRRSSVRGGRLEPATWDEALDLVHARLTGIQREHGREAVAVFGGGGLTNEKAYTLGKFARVVLGTPFIDYNGRFCMSSAAAGANRTLGVDRGLTFPLADLGGADAVLVVGSNPAATMPPLVQHLAGARAHGGLVVVDPRRSATAAATEDGGGIAPRPGAGHRPRRPPRPDPRPRRRGTGRRGVRAGAHDRLGCRARVGLAVVARARRDGRAASPPTCCAPPPGGSPPRRRSTAGAGPTCSPAAAWSSRPRAPTASRRPSTSPSRSASSAASARATARSPGRATARVGASTGSRATSCPGTG